MTSAFLLAILVIAHTDGLPYLITVGFDTEAQCERALERAMKMTAHPRIRSIAQCGTNDGIQEVLKVLADKVAEDKKDHPQDYKPKKDI